MEQPKQVKKVCNLFKITEIKSIIDSIINGENYNKRFELQTLLFDIYKQTEGKEKHNVIESLNYDSREHRSLRVKCKASDSHLNKLKVIDPEVTSALFKQYNIMEVEGSAEARHSFLVNYITDLNNKLQSLLSGQKELQAKKALLQEEYLNSRTQFLKNVSKEYKELKDKLRLDNKLVIDDLRKNVDNLPSKELKALLKTRSVELEQLVVEKLAAVSELFKIKTQIDEIKSNSFRTSKASKVFSFLLEQQLDVIVNAVQTSNNERRSVLYTSHSKDKSIALIKPSVSDLLASSSLLEKSEYYIYFASAYKHLLSDKLVNYSSKYDKLYNTISKMTNNAVIDKIKFDDSLLKTIAIILYQSVEQLCEYLLAQVKSSDNYTFKAETFHLVLSPIYSYSSQSYDNLRNTINAKWLH